MSSLPFRFNESNTVWNHIISDASHISRNMVNWKNIDKISIAYFPRNKWENMRISLNIYKIFDTDIGFFRNWIFYALIDWYISERFSIFQCEKIRKYFMPLNPKNIRKRKGVFECREKCRNISKCICLESIDKSIPYGSFCIRFFDSLISRRKTCPHEKLMKWWIQSGKFRYKFLTQDINFSLGFCDYFYWFFKRSKKYSFPKSTWSIDFSYFMKSSKWAHGPDTIPSRYKNIKTMIGFIIKNNFSSFERSRFYFMFLTKRKKWCKETVFKHRDYSSVNIAILLRSWMYLSIVERETCLCL